METKICKCCGKELPIDSFPFKKGMTTRKDTCNVCIGEKIRQSKKRVRSFPKPKSTYNDAMFDGKTPREVQDILARAAKWLNNYGGFTCEVSLRYEKSIPLDIH